MLKDIYIWGAGKYGDMAYIYYKDDCNILGYIDSMPEKCGTLKNGISIYAPDILKIKQWRWLLLSEIMKVLKKKLREQYANSKHFFIFAVWKRLFLL